MWRLANCVYRAFRNSATHRCSQDVLVPLTTICNTDDEESKSKEQAKCPCRVEKCDIHQVLKANQFSYKNIEKLQQYLKQLTQTLNVIEPAKKAKPVVEEVPSLSSSTSSEETLDSLLKTDKASLNTMKNLSDLHEETMSIVNLQLALDALESGNYQFGIETLQTLTKIGTNAAALYNLGICYERGIGVESDRAKACDYYRQASTLGHVNAQFNLTLLSNHIDIHENDDESDTSEQTITKQSTPLLRAGFFRFLLSNDYKEDQSLNDDQFEFKNSTLACLT